MTEEKLVLDDQSRFVQFTSITSPFYEKYQLRPYNPAELYRKTGSYKIYDEMREDDQISALLHTKKNLIFGSGYDIECEDEYIEEFLEHDLKINNFSQVLYEISSAFDYGFSLTEMTFKPIQEGPYAGLFGIGSLKTRPPHTFEIHQDEYGEPLFIRQTRSGASVDIPYEKFLHFVNDREFDNLYGESDLNRGVYTAWWSKKAIIKFWNIYLERYGSPLAVGKYDPKLVDPESVAQLNKILLNLSAKTGITLPSDIELTFIEATKDGSKGYELAIDKYNLMMARKMGMPDLFGLSGSETSGGSYSLGDKQIRMYLQGLDRVRKELERIISTKLLKTLTLLNFGPEYTPKFIFRPISEDEKIDKLKLYFDGVQKGAIPTLPEDANWIRQILGAPEVPLVEAESMIEGEVYPEEQLSLEAPQPEQILPEPEYAQQHYALKSIGPWDKKVNYTEISSFLDRQTAKMKSEMGEILKDSVRALITEVKAKQVVEKKKFVVVRQLTLKNWDKFRVALKRGFRAAVDQGFSDARSEIGDVKNNSMVPIDPTKAEDFLDEVTAELSNMKRDEILRIIKINIQAGIQAGQNTNDILSRIDVALKGYDTSIEDAQGVSAPKLETMINTNMSNAYNQGRLEYFAEASKAIQGLQFSAIMDDRTTEVCSQLHGKVFSPIDAQSINPPLHYNCRSILVPVTIAEEKPELSRQSDIPPRPDGYFK